MRAWQRLMGVSICVCILAACGGGTDSPLVGGGNRDGSSGNGTGTSTLQPFAVLAQQCAPDNPYTADASAPTTPASLTVEKQWVRSYMDYAYLWYDQVPTVDASAAAYSGAMTQLDYSGVPLPLSNYFDALRTLTLTASGKRLDQFSFTYPTLAWKQLSQSGVTAGYGIEWSDLADAPPRSWRVAIVQPGSPAAVAGLMRGDVLASVDGVDFANGSDVTTLNNGLLPVAGATHTLVFTRAGNVVPIVASMTASANVVIDPVPVATVLNGATGKIGYLHFTDHIASSEAKLIAAVNSFKAQGITDLVLDLRYNGGGFLYIADELAYMIAGPDRVSGKFFEKLAFNAKRTADNAEAATPFATTSCILDASFNCTSTQPLPTLNLGRVYVIAQDSTCSASEAIINGLSGVDVQVFLIGSTTCGKPYGFTAHDNCGVSYFPIEFKGVNYKGFGDYADGFSPVAANPGNANLLGCPAVDDVSHPLGNTLEHMLAITLRYVADGTCLPPGGVAMPATLAAAHRMASAATVGSPLSARIRQNGWLLPNGRR
jgi:hypothetical protein